MKTNLKEKIILLVFCIIFFIMSAVFAILNCFVIQKLSGSQINSKISDEVKPLSNEDGYIYFIISHDNGTKTVSLSGYNGSEKELYIPSEINGCMVTDIDNACFVYCDTLEKVVVPNSVLSIGDVAFGSCINLRDITIPETVNDMGVDVFVDTAQDLVIHCKKDSYAHVYAAENGYKSEII